MLGIAGVAFLLRLGAGLAKGPDYVDHGYTFYAEIARTFWDGNGLCAAPGVECAVRVPLYPLLIAPFLALDAAYPWLIVFQALVGAAIPLLAFVLGRHLFGASVGLIAAAGTAFNPYAVIHGPSFQDTVIFDALIALSVWLLIVAARRAHPGLHAAAGVTLALATLTTVRLALFVPVALAWVIAANRGRGARATAHATAMFALPIVILLGSWIARNAAIVGAPVLTTEAGLSLWLANNDVTMSILPGGSIDTVEEPAWLRVSHHQARLAEELAGDPVAYDRFLGQLGIDYVTGNPGRALVAAVQKVVVSFCGWLSPARDWPVQLGYLLLFLPVNVLALIGLWRARGEGGAHLLVILLFVTFAITTAVFWAHTSHRSFLHAFKFIYAAKALGALAPKPSG